MRQDLVDASLKKKVVVEEQESAGISAFQGMEEQDVLAQVSPQSAFFFEHDLIICLAFYLKYVIIPIKDCPRLFGFVDQSQTV